MKKMTESVVPMMTKKKTVLLVLIFFRLADPAVFIFNLVHSFPSRKQSVSATFPPQSCHISMVRACARTRPLLPNKKRIVAKNSALLRSQQMPF